MVRERSETERYHDARHEAAHVVVALYFKVPVAYAQLTPTGGAVRMGTQFPTYNEEILYVIQHAEEYAAIYMAGKAYERLAGTPPYRMAMLTEADHAGAREYLQNKTGDLDINSSAINDELERATERANVILANHIKLWDALTDAILKQHTIRWDDIRMIAVAAIES